MKKQTNSKTEKKKRASFAFNSCPQFAFLFWIYIVAEKFQNVGQGNYCHAVSQMQLICTFPFHTYL